MITTYKYHEYIDQWIYQVKLGEVKACKEQIDLIDFAEKVLNSEDVFIHSDKIYEAVEIVEKYFPFKLIPCQKFFFAFVSGVFYEDDSPVFDEFFLFMGRGSGKNGLISAISFYLLSDKNGVRNYDIDIIATSEKQASTSFFEVYDVIDVNEKLKKIFDYTKEQITFKKTNSTLRFCTSNAKTKDGGRPGALIFDEIHQYENYDNITVHTGGLGKVKKPRTFYITTDGQVRESVLDDIKEKAQRILRGEDPHNGFFPFIFKMDSEEEVDNPDLWEKAIPRINFDKTLKRTVLKAYKNMHQSADLKADFFTKRMNLVKQNEAKVVADWEEIKATNQEFLDFTGNECIGALDYADLKDFCTVGLLFKKNGKRYFKQHTFIHIKSIQHTKYNINIDEAVDLGLATIVKDAPIIPPALIVEWFKKEAVSYGIKKVVADRYRYAALKEAFDQVGMIFEGIPSGYITHNRLHPLITQLFANHMIVFGDDKLMRWYVNNCYVQTDSKGNKSYHKIEPIKRKTDGFFCFLHAMSEDEQLVEAGEFLSLDVYTY